MKEVIMTSEKRKELEEKLEYLKTVGRDQAAARISEARGYGDLSENSEYDEAMNDQAKLEGQIAEIESQLKHARILDESEMSSEHVHVGSKVVIADANGNVYDAQTATGDLIKHTYTVTSTIVENSKGVELPSTGGEGTFWLITLGTLMAIGFAVFLITNKKMSVYTD